MNFKFQLSEQTLEEYFFENIKNNSKQIALEMSNEVLTYSVHLLLRFAHSEQLFIQDSNGLSLPTLAFLYRDALAASNNRDRCNLIRTLGDTSLYLSACFPTVGQRRGVSRDYYIDMGISAFDALTAFDPKKYFPYQELSQNFRDIADCMRLSVFYTTKGEAK